MIGKLSGNRIPIWCWLVRVWIGTNTSGAIQHYLVQLKKHTLTQFYPMCISQRNLQIGAQEIGKWTFTEALFTVVNNWIQPKYPSVGKWIRIHCYVLFYIHITYMLKLLQGHHPAKKLPSILTLALDVNRELLVPTLESFFQLLFPPWSSLLLPWSHLPCYLPKAASTVLLAWNSPSSHLQPAASFLRFWSHLSIGFFGEAYTDLSKGDTLLWLSSCYV